MSATTETTDVSFDPFNQPINITIPDVGILQISLNDLSYWQLYASRACINYGSQFGASLMLFILLIVLTNSDKRRSAIFVTNCIGLICNAIKNLLQGIYFTTEYWNPYVYLSGDTSRVTRSEVAQQVTSAVMPFIVYACVLASLNLQIRVMLTAATAPWQRIAILCTSYTIAFLTLAFRFCLSAINSRAIVADDTGNDWQWLPQACNIFLTIAICYSSAIFGAKLVFAIRQRRSIGMQEFGPLQILFIMSLQTFLIPALFSLVQFASNVAQTYSLVQTAALLCLPLSAIWASTAIGERQSAAGFKTPSFVKQWKDSVSSSSASSPDCRKASHATQDSVRTPRIMEEGRVEYHPSEDLVIGTHM